MEILEDDVRGGIKVQLVKTYYEAARNFLCNLRKAMPKDRPDNRLYHDVAEAQRDWKNSLSYFNDVTDAELVDYAIYSMSAAEHRYSYLLKKAKEELGFEKLKIV